MRTGATIKVKGLNEINRKLLAFAKQKPKDVMDALEQIGERIMADSKQNYVPVDLGTLRDDGRVVREKWRVLLVYGGASDAYSITVHEHPSGYDPPSWRGGDVKFKPQGRGPKFLERPTLEALPKILGWVKQECKF